MGTIRRMQQANQESAEGPELIMSPWFELNTSNDNCVLQIQISQLIQINLPLYQAWASFLPYRPQLS